MVRPPTEVVEFVMVFEVCLTLTMPYFARLLQVRHGGQVRHYALLGHALLSAAQVRHGSKTWEVSHALLRHALLPKRHNHNGFLVFAQPGVRHALLGTMPYFSGAAREVRHALLVSGK